MDTVARLLQWSKFNKLQQVVSGIAILFNPITLPAHSIVVPIEE